MAPEQLEGKEVDSRADIFGLGSMLYEMVTGKRAFAGANQATLIAAIVTAEPPRVSELQPSSPPLLDHLIRKCLAKDPDERWRSAADLAGELEWLVGVRVQGLGQKSDPRSVPSPRQARPQNYRIEYFQSPDGASIAAARGGTGTPLVVIPTMAETIETGWANYAEVFGNYEVIMYDRRGSGLSERDSAPGEPEPYLEDAQTVVDGFQLDEFDLLGGFMGTIEATSLASRNADRVTRLVLRAPVTGLAHWASIPSVHAALAALEQDWTYFTESFSQFVVGWGDPKGREMAARFQAITSRDELKAMFDAFIKLDLIPVYPEIRATTLRHRNRPSTLMVFGQVMLGAIRTNGSPISVDETVPLARLLNEYEVIAVPADSHYRTLQELIQDFRTDPARMSWAGGSAGGSDHILVGLIAQAAGVEPAKVNYIAYSGGGEAAVAVMGGHVTVGVSGFGEWKAYVESGRMRLLAVSSPERVGDRGTPTIRESGLDVVLANWRGIAAPPGTDQETRDWLVRALTRMRESSAWQDIVRANDWEDSFLAGPAFEQFLSEEVATIDRILRAIGLIR